MLKNRLIFTLLMQNGNYMLSRNFSLQLAGDLNWIKEYYDFNAIAFSIDELVVLNVERQIKNISNFAKNLIELSQKCFVPIAAGGGIRNIDDAYILLNSGADKLVVNTSLIEDPELVVSLVRTFGSQCVVASIDYKKINNCDIVFISDGSKNTGLTVEEAIKNAQNLGAGEIYLSSMDKDGTGQGYDLELVSKIRKIVSVPLIISGGAGKFDHLAEAITKAGVTAVSTANLFNFLADGLTEAREFMKGKGISLATWDFGDYLN